MKPDDFWLLSPYEFSLIVDGYIRRERKNANNLIALAWNSECFARTKKLPPLNDLLLKDEKEVVKEKPQTNDDMMTMCKLLNAAYGGKEVKT